LKDYTTICSSAPSEQLGVTALEHGSRILARNRRILQQNLGLFTDLVRRHPEVLRHNPGQGGSIIFPSFRDGRSGAEFSRKLREKANLLMLSGDLFDMPEHFFRVGLGRAGLGETLELFEENL